MKQFNENLCKYLSDYKSKLSSDSQSRLEQGNALRILDSKSQQDEDLLISLKDKMPRLDEYCD